MRRSTKVAMISACGIAALTAQIGPYEDRLGARGLDQHRIDHARFLLSRLNDQRIGAGDPAYRLLALVAGPRVLAAAAGNRN